MMDRWLLLGLALMLVFAPFGWAHRTNYALTELTWRVDHQSLEVVHQVHLDDAVVLLAHLGDFDARLDAETERELLAYLGSTFQLELQGEPVVLQAVGAQIDGDSLWLFQETQMTLYPEAMNVRTRFLFDFFPNQTQQVNLIVGSQVESLLLDRQTDQGQF